MEVKRTLSDYVSGRCMSANDDREFALDWMSTDGEPCLVCRKALKSVCTLYGDLSEKNVSRKNLKGYRCN
jgi:hypothetical protein